MFLKLFQLSRHVKLKTLMPDLLNRITEWEHADDAPIQAGTLSVEEMRQVLALPKMPYFAHFVCHMIAGVNGAQRGCENGPEKLLSDVNFSSQFLK